MSLAPDTKMKLPAAKVIPVHGNDPGHQQNPAKNFGLKRSRLPGSSLFHRLLHEEAGQDLIEYAFIMALVGLGAIAAVSGMAGKLKNTLSVIGSDLVSAN